MKRDVFSSYRQHLRMQYTHTRYQYLNLEMRLFNYRSVLNGVQNCSRFSFHSGGRDHILCFVPLRAAFSQPELNFRNYYFVGIHEIQYYMCCDFSSTAVECSGFVEGRLMNWRKVLTLVRATLANPWP